MTVRAVVALLRGALPGALPGALLGVLLLASPATLAAQESLGGDAGVDALADTLPEIVPDTLDVPRDSIPTLLASEDRRAEGFAAIAAVAAAESGQEATLWLQLLTLARKTGPAAGSLAARAVLHLEGDDPAAPADSIEEGLGEVEEEDRPALLALAARLAEHDPSRAAGFRERLLELDPEATEAQEARLRLARHLAEGPDEARQRALTLLEELVVGDPSHPLAPEARRFLQEIRGGST